jgi:hypothetical protein
MTAVLTPNDAVSVVPRPTARPIWRTYGGGGIAVGGSLLLIATIMEWAMFAQGGPGSAWFAPFALTFYAALVLLALATIPLAFGSTGSDGLMRRSVLGKAGILAYGWGFLASQIAYLLSVYVLGPGTERDAVGAIGAVFTALQVAGALAAIVAVLRGDVATGLARWVLIPAVAVGIAGGALSNAGAPLEATMAVFCLSALAQSIVGVSFLVSRQAAPRRRAA